ncbi:hypothetical protein AB0B28_16705 [Glycomyces sp. NPDC046736]|uniref:hypothetical protein n=1 Tax=Glycomyces sp. NPDC046736 TaxID=3155615 RepID=UPI0033FBEEBE
MPDPHGLTPAEAAWLRDPRHPIHNGFRLHPVPNLIVNPGVRIRVGDRRMSYWMRRNIIMAHYAPLALFLYYAGIVALLLTFLVAAPLLLGVGDCDPSDGPGAESSTCFRL